MQDFVTGPGCSFVGRGIVVVLQSTHEVLGPDEGYPRTSDTETESNKKKQDFLIGSRRWHAGKSSLICRASRHETSALVPD